MKLKLGKGKTNHQRKNRRLSLKTRRNRINILLPFSAFLIGRIITCSSVSSKCVETFIRRCVHRVTEIHRLFPFSILERGVKKIVATHAVVAF